MRKLFSRLKNRRVVSIGGRKLVLYLDDRHEREYFDQATRGTKDIDRLIAERYLRKGDVVLDAGANIGFTSLVYLENGASKVFSFEPVPEVYSRLARLISENLEAHNVALSDSNGPREMTLSVAHNQGHTLNPDWEKVFPDVYEGQRVTSEITTMKLDDMFNGQRFDFVKVDIEGHEAAFLRGAAETFRRSPPRVLQIEIYPQVFEPVYQELVKYFKWIKRVRINTESEAIELLDIPGTEPSTPDEPDSGPPVYLCSNHLLLLSEGYSGEGQYLNGYFLLDRFADLEFGGACLQKVLDEVDFETVLDVGSGSGSHAEIFESFGKRVTQVDFGESCYFDDGAERARSVIKGDYLSCEFDEQFDLIWASHVLEHQPNVNLFLKKLRKDLKEGGTLAITVPPMKAEIVGGHLSLWNAGLLLYNLVMAGFDCKEARVLRYGYNISVVLENQEAELPALSYDKGDIEKLLKFFPDGIHEPFDGDIERIGW
jgi:FkbM family methyltransferase